MLSAKRNGKYITLY